MTMTLSPPQCATVRLETFSSFEDIETLETEWDALVTKLNGSLYATFRWCEVWWRHYGAGRDLRLIMVRTQEDLVGLLPFFIDRLRSPFGWTRVAKLVGSDFTPVLMAPPIQRDVATMAFTLAIEQLFRDDDTDMVHIGPCSATGTELEAVRRAVAEGAAAPRIVRDRESGSHTVFEVPDGFDAYVRSLSKNQRSNYRRNINKLNSAFDFHVDVLRHPSDLEAEFDAFIEMHQAQWRAVNKLGHFGDWPKSREFSRDLVRTLAPEDRVRLIRLRAGDRAVSYYWCFCLNDTYYWRLPARLSGDPWDQFALGRVGLIKMLEAAAAEGGTRVEAGTGRYEYKEKLNARTVPLNSITLCRRDLASRVRARAMIVYSEILHIAYYRLWYVRVAPRLRFFRSPLSQNWIRRGL